VPIGNAEVGLLLNGLKTKMLTLDDILLDDIAAKTVAVALLSVSTGALETLKISNCVTARGAKMIQNSVYNSTSLDGVLGNNHTLLKLNIEDEHGKNATTIDLDRFYHQLDPHGKNPALKEESFAMLKVMTYMKDNYKSSEVEAIPLKLHTRLLEAFGRLGNLDIFFQIIRNKDLLTKSVTKVW